MCGRVNKLNSPNTGRSSRASLKLHGNFKLYFQTMMVKHPSKNKQVLSNLSDWLELENEQLNFWQRMWSDFEMLTWNTNHVWILFSDFLFPTFRLKGCACPRVEFVITVFLALRCNSSNECRQLKTNLFISSLNLSLPHWGMYLLQKILGNCLDPESRVREYICQMG